jgi:hypothetical protein
MAFGFRRPCRGSVEISSCKDFVLGLSNSHFNEVPILRPPGGARNGLCTYKSFSCKNWFGQANRVGGSGRASWSWTTGAGCQRDRASRGHAKAPRMRVVFVG